MRMLPSVSRARKYQFAPDACFALRYARASCLRIPSALANRRVRISVSYPTLISSVANDIGSLRIMEGATVLQNVNTIILSAVSGLTGGTFAFVLVPTAGSHTYKFNCIRAAGSGTETFQTNASSNIQIIAEDLGPSAAPA